MIQIMSKGKVRILSFYLVLYMYLRYGEYLRSFDIKIIVWGRYLRNI